MSHAVQGLKIHAGGAVTLEVAVTDEADAAVKGGQFNIASGDLSSVSGGESNAASGFASSVSGGRFVTSNGDCNWGGEDMGAIVAQFGDVVC